MPAPPVPEGHVGLTWSRPKVRKHPTLGRRKIWFANQGGYQVHRLLDYVLPSPFSASVSDAAGGSRLLGHSKTLRAAQRACEQDHKQRKGAPGRGRTREPETKPRRRSKPRPPKEARAA